MKIYSTVDANRHWFFNKSVENILNNKISFINFNNLLFKIFNQNLNSLKIFNLCLLTFFFIYLSVIFKKCVKLILNYSYNNNIFIILSLFGVLNFYYNWRLTPDYDYFNLLGLVIYLSGLLLFFLKKEFDQKHNIFHCSLLISIGLFFCIVTKPSTFVILSLLTLLICVFVTNKKFEFFVTSFFLILFSLLLFLFFLKIINISPYEYISDLKFGSNIKKLQDPRYEIQFLLFGSAKQILYFLYQNIYLFIFVPIIFYIEKEFFDSKNYLIILYISFIFLIFKSPLLAMSVFIFYLLSFKYNHLKNDFLRIIFLPFVLFCGYLAISVGTNTNFITHLKRSDFILFLIFFSLFSFLKIDQKYNNKLKDNFFLFIIFIFVTLQFTKTILKTYDDENLFDKDKKIEVKFFKNNFYLDEIDKDFLLHIQNIFKQNGWKEGGELIELSGRYPIFNIILDAKYVSKPWYLGGYAGSENFVRGFFKETDINLIKRSWIIASDYKYGISLKLLKEFNIELTENYISIGSFIYKKRNTTFYIYKPLQAK